MRRPWIGFLAFTLALPARGEAPRVGPGGGPLVSLGRRFAFMEVGFLAGPGILRLSFLEPDLQRGIRLAEDELVLKVRDVRDRAGEVLRSESFRLELFPVSNAETFEGPGNTSEFAGQSEWLAGAASFEVLLRQARVKGRPVRVVRFRYP